MDIYCVKCKQKTGTLEMTEVLTKNNRHMVRGKCNVCGKIKSTFVKSIRGTATGTGLNDLISNLPFEFHQFAEKGENVPAGSFNGQQKYSFCGPGTKYEQRLKEGYMGINKLDQYCKLHDKFYNEHSDTNSRNVSDVALAARADEIASNPAFDEIQRKDARFISGIMKTKAALGMGLKTKKQSSKN
jgi:hypothetical protein